MIYSRFYTMILDLKLKAELYNVLNESLISEKSLAKRWNAHLQKKRRLEDV